MAMVVKNVQEVPESVVNTFLGLVSNIWLFICVVFDNFVYYEQILMYELGLSRGNSSVWYEYMLLNCVLLFFVWFFPRLFKALYVYFYDN